MENEIIFYTGDNVYMRADPAVAYEETHALRIGLQRTQFVFNGGQRPRIYLL